MPTTASSVFDGLRRSGVALISVVALVGACSDDPGQTQITMTQAQFDSVADLASASEVVVVGQVLETSSVSHRKDELFGSASVKVKVDEVIGAAETQGMKDIRVSPGSIVDAKMVVLDPATGTSVEEDAAFRRSEELPKPGDTGVFFGAVQPQSGDLEWLTYAHRDSNDSVTFDGAIGGSLARATVTTEEVRKQVTGSLGQIALANEAIKSEEGDGGPVQTGPVATSTIPNEPSNGG